MNVGLRARSRTPRRGADDGFTLIEVVIALVLSTLIVGVVVAALFTSQTVVKSATAQINASNDTGLISAFLYRDAQSAGGIDPTSGQPNALGVSIDPSNPSNCALTPPAITTPVTTSTLKIRFSWVEFIPPVAPLTTVVQSTVVALYVVDTPTQVVTRQLCRDGIHGPSVTLAQHVGSVTATCLPSCISHPDSVSLTVYGSGAQATFFSVLTASLRSVASQLAISAPTSWPPGQLGVAYTSSAGSVIGGTGPSYTWSTSPALPNGLSINASTGALSGAPSVSGLFNLVLKVTDLTTGATATRPYSLTINVSLTVSWPVLPNGEVGVAYVPNAAGSASGGTAPYTWSAPGLPAGLTINSTNGVVSGSPTTAATSTPVITVTDSLGVFATNSAYSVTIYPALAISAPASWPNGEVNVPYVSTTMVRTGGSTSVAWTSTLLPAGLTLNSSTGVLSGTPTATGTPTIVVTATDAFTSVTRNYSFTVYAALVISAPATLPNGELGKAYVSTTMVRTGGTTTVAWTATGLPTGLTLNSSTGVISGTPTATGTPTVVVKATDALTNVTRSYTFTVYAALVISAPATLPDGRTSDVYTTTTMVRTGGTPTVTWTATGLPAGLSMSTAGILSGTPTASGTFASVVVKATDALTNVTRTYSLTVVKKTYFDTTNETVGLISYWRLGETSAGASDTFTGNAGATLQTHTGDTGSTWTKPSVGTWADAVLTTSTGRIRKGGTTPSVAMYYSSAVPASADYSVSADVIVTAVPLPVNDAIGVVGRLDPTASPSGTYYQAYYELSSQKWTLGKRTAGGFTFIAQTNVTTLAVGTYRLTLDMSGSTIRLLINGVQQISVVDASITAAGRAGVVLGWNNQDTIDTDTTGLQLDNFSVSSVSPAVGDAKGTNVGSYVNTPTLGVPGAISASGDANTAVTFDGANDYATVTRQISDDFSIEFWFKSTQGIGTTGTTWTTGAGLVDGSVSGVANDFGVSLRADGKILAGVGPGTDVSILSTTGGYNNGGWHHVVFTRTKSTGALALYIDGVAKGTATGSTVSLNAAANINFGRIQGAANNYFAGSLDEVAVYNTVLTQAIVTAHFTAAS